MKVYIAEDDLVEEANAIESCQRGNEGAFRTIVEKYNNFLFGVSYLLVKDRQEAKDLVQETFVKAWLAIGRFDQSRPLKPWLKTILLNQFRNLYRKSSKVKILDIDIVEEPTDTQEDGFDLVVQKEQKEVVLEAFESLNDTQKKTVYLRFYASLSLREIAVAMSVSEGTVKSRLSRAIGTMGSFFKKDVLLEDGCDKSRTYLPEPN